MAAPQTDDVFPLIAASLHDPFILDLPFKALFEKKAKIL